MKFSVSMWNNFSTEYKRWWPNYIKKITPCQHRPTLKLFLGPRPGDVVADFTDGFILNNFRLLSFQIKYSAY
jgi:hypothetical protein